MIIISAADERFAAHFAAMLHSAWTHHPTAEFYFLDCGLKPGTLADLQELATKRGIRLNIIRVDATAFCDLPTTKALSAAAYARLLIPDLLPKTVERVLYLDADTIVVSDLTALWQTDMGEAAIAAVHDPAATQIEREIGIDVDEGSYVNSGVMLMNLVVWRDEELATTAMAFAKKHNPRTCDQPSINFACAGKITYVPEEWNFQLIRPRRQTNGSSRASFIFRGPRSPGFIATSLSPRSISIIATKRHLSSSAHAHFAHRCGRCSTCSSVIVNTGTSSLSRVGHKPSLRPTSAGSRPAR
jgi:lipopolysaccharide biosynthesis glycosyltransferase